MASSKTKPEVDGFDELSGSWTNSSGEKLTIRGGEVFWPQGISAKLARRGDAEFAIILESQDVFHCRLEPNGNITWSDGDVWQREQPPVLSSPSGQREVAAAESRRRIAAAGRDWHDVLHVQKKASAEDVKRAFHELALLHHPDKGLTQGDAATFQVVQTAYEEGLREIELATAGPSNVAVARPREGLLVALNAPKQELREAMDHWENCLDDGTTDHIPDEIEQRPLEQVVQQLLEGHCIPVDVRQPEEKYGANKAPLPGAIEIGYMGLLKSPETVIRRVVELHRRLDERNSGGGQHVVCYSTHGGTSGTCAVVACALLDVFGLKGESVCTLENGYLGWKTWRDQNRAAVEKMRGPA